MLTLQGCGYISSWDQCPVQLCWMPAAWMRPTPQGPFALGGLPPRTIKPPNLRLALYRGGNRPIDIFWRIRLGIERTPMPAATLKPEGDPNAKGLTENDIWDIVNYVHSLPSEAINNPHY